MVYVVVDDLAGAYPEYGEVLQRDQREVFVMEEEVFFRLARKSTCPAVLCGVFLKSEAVVPQPRVTAGPSEVPFLELALTCKVE